MLGRRQPPSYADRGDSTFGIALRRDAAGVATSLDDPDAGPGGQLGDTAGRDERRAISVHAQRLPTPVIADRTRQSSGTMARPAALSAVSGKVGEQRCPSRGRHPPAWSLRAL